MPLRALGMWIGQAQRATASGERIFEIIDEPEEIADAPAARDASARRRRDPLRARLLRVPARPAGPRAASTSTSPPGTTIALIGHTGSGKTTLTSLVPRFYDVDRPAASRRRRRRSRRHAALPAPRDRRHRAGSLPLLGHRAREHRLRPPRPLRRGRSSGRARRPGARVHRAPAARLRHRDRRARDHPLRRPAATHRDRPRARDRPAHPDPRRRHRLGRRDDRGANPRGPPRGDARPDDAHHRAPALDDRARRRDRRARRRAHRRARHARRAHRGRAPSTGRSTSTGSSSGSSPTPSRRAARWRTSPEGPSGRQQLMQERGAGSRTGRGHGRAGGSALLWRLTQPYRAPHRLLASSRSSPRRRPRSPRRYLAKFALDDAINARRRHRLYIVVAHLRRRGPRELGMTTSRPTSRAGSASGSSPTFACASSSTCSGSRSASTSATAPA